MKPLARLVTLVVVLLVLSVACAAPAPSAAPPKAAPPSISGSGADPMTQLLDLAKKEGGLVWNIGTGDGSYQPAVDAFKRRFPDLNTEVIVVSSPEVPARIISEQGAGKVTLDVSWGSVGSMMPLIDRDSLPRIDWTGLNVNKDRILLDGRAVKVADSPYVIYYNKNLVPAAEVPRGWEDLLHERWKGKIALTGGMTYLIGLPLVWGEERALDYIQKLGKQSIARLPRVAASLDAVGRGEYLIGMGQLPMVLLAIKNGTPLEVAPIGPQIAFLTVATSFVGAPHPNAARLLLSWLASDEGEQAFAAGGYISFTRKPTLDEVQGKLITDKGIQLEFEDTLEKSRLNQRLTPTYIRALGFQP